MGCSRFASSQEHLSAFGKVGGVNAKPLQNIHADFIGSSGP
jgi:hypothetical protein